MATHSTSVFVTLQDLKKGYEQRLRPLLKGPGHLCPWKVEPHGVRNLNWFLVAVMYFLTGPMEGELCSSFYDSMTR
ncbi:hypothetical protein AK812_SmicGene17044 [Symbiodinium microadriaticum]|uniref:Uncharacterized protein n=1 Tax=Symbiodinium microadriaticum TaxID=2951 RepID=A0A1Q9DYN9_SYMMI|nr:hypothetical protein AK812_SmicGene17044 [Symbiodinium microadriaticum]